MRNLIFIICFTPSLGFSQKLSKEKVFTYITERWKSVRIKKSGKVIVIDSALLHSCNYFYIDEKEYDSIKAEKKIKSICDDDLILANFSLYNTPIGYGIRIVIHTKAGQSKSYRKFTYDNISNTAFNIRPSTSVDSVFGSKNCALILNDSLIDPEKVISTFFSIKFDFINYIGYTIGYQTPFYGEDSKNGVVFIWTKGNRK